jgi:predicted LPLAT superfamily acyltransferase
MSTAWLRQRERGHLFFYRFIMWVALSVGRPAARFLLYPICTYYLLFSFKAGRAIRRFFKIGLKQDVTVMTLFHHYYVFASTLLDRVYLWLGQFYRFRIDVHGIESLDLYSRRQQGCILLGSHLGSFEIVRAVGLAKQQLEIKVLMHELNASKIGGILRNLNPDIAETVIAVGDPSTMLKVKECVDRGGLVGIMGDRLMGKEHAVSCMFLGRQAFFPSGGIRLANAVRVPIVLFFGLYRGGNRYEIHFESFADEVKLHESSREEEIQAWTQRYASRLEHYCRLAPDNWFNFYDFWQEHH